MDDEGEGEGCRGMVDIRVSKIIIIKFNIVCLQKVLQKIKTFFSFILLMIQTSLMEKCRPIPVTL